MPDQKLEREKAVNFIADLCQQLDAYADNAQSNMPARLDPANFSNSLSQIKAFCSARPDWTLEILQKLHAL